MIRGVGAVKRAVPEMIVYASAPSYLRQYADLFTAGAVEQGLCDGMLFGRMAFADPDFANEIVKSGRIDPKRVCMRGSHPRPQAHRLCGARRGHLHALLPGVPGVEKNAARQFPRVKGTMAGGSP